MKAILCALACAVLVAGCGSGSETGSSASPAAPNRYFGDHPGQQATAAHLSGGDCRALAVVAEAQLGQDLRWHSEPSPPSSRCRLLADGVQVSVYLDAGYAARQRYANRMTEQIQFNAPDPAKIPHSVAGVGDRSAGEHDASWIPAYSTLFAVRGNRWLTVAYSVAGESRAQRLRGAAVLARRGFKLTAR
jgi:hypothetical protein